MQQSKNSVLKSGIVLFKQFSEHPKFPFYLAMIWFVAFSITWVGELKSDDFFHRALLLGSEELYSIGLEEAKRPATALEATTTLFGFFSGDAAVNQRMKDVGVLPWWSDEELKLFFWRPFSALTHWIDYKLWPDNLKMMQVHSLAWHAMLLLMIALVFRVLGLPLWVSGFAALIYTLDFSFFAPLKWIANRNAMITAFWGASSLYAYILWRKDSNNLGGVFSCVCLLFALLSGEGGISTVAYLFAYEVFINRSKLFGKALALIPPAIVVIVWRVYYKQHDYGALNNGLYTDPLTDPLTFIWLTIERGTTLLFYQFAAIDSVNNLLSPAGNILFFIIAVLFLVFFGYMLYPLLKRSPQARFALSGALLAVVPSCATSIPTGRLLFFVSMGGSLVVALLIADIGDNANRASRWLRNYLKVFHVGLASLVWIVVTVVILFLGPPPIPSILVTDLPGTNKAQPTVLVNAPNPFVVIYLHLYREYHGLSTIKGLGLLSPAYTPLTLTRTDKNKVELFSDYGLVLHANALPKSDDETAPFIGGVYVSKALSDFLRDGQSTFNKGDTFKTGLFNAEVLEVNGIGDPTRVEFTFSSSEGDTSIEEFNWLAWNEEDQTYELVPLPSKGNSLNMESSF